jgi:hypothetical protein
MSICEICGMDVTTVHSCSECGASFCEECGDVKHKLCYDCLGWKGTGEDELLDEGKDWDSEDFN